MTAVHIFHSPTTDTVPVKTSYMEKGRARSTYGKPSLNSSVALKGNANPTENMICNVGVVSDAMETKYVVAVYQKLTK